MCWVSQQIVLIHPGSSWQPINVSWLSLNFKSPQQRAIAYAVYSKRHTQKIQRNAGTNYSIQWDAPTWAEPTATRSSEA